MEKTYVLFDSLGRSISYLLREYIIKNNVRSNIMLFDDYFDSYNYDILFDVSNKNSKEDGYLDLAFYFDRNNKYLNLTEDFYSKYKVSDKEIKALKGDEYVFILDEDTIGSFDLALRIIDKIDGNKVTCLCSRSFAGKSDDQVRLFDKYLSDLNAKVSNVYLFNKDDVFEYLPAKVTYSLRRKLFEKILFKKAVNLSTDFEELSVYESRSISEFYYMIRDFCIRNNLPKLQMYELIHCNDYWKRQSIWRLMLSKRKYLYNPVPYPNKMSSYVFIFYKSDIFYRIRNPKIGFVASKEYILKEVGEAYRTFTFKRIFPYLDFDCVWESQWVIEPIIGYRAVVNYYLNKTEIMHKTNSECEYKLIELHNIYKPGVLIKQTFEDGETDIVVLDITFSDNNTFSEKNKISRIDVCNPALYDIVDLV